MMPIQTDFTLIILKPALLINFILFHNLILAVRSMGYALIQWNPHGEKSGYLN